jgi:hypothetical protein
LILLQDFKYDEEVYRAMKRIKYVLLAALIGLSALTLGSCSKSEDDRGPMEKAGKALDESMEKAKEQTGRIMEKAGESLKETGEKMQDSGKAEQKQ